MTIYHAALPVDSPSEPQCPHRKEFSTTGFSSKEDPHWCDLNEDEYGRPYYGPIDEYNGPGHYTLSQLNTRHFNRPSRQTWTLDQCITSDECKEQPSKLHSYLQVASHNTVTWLPIVSTVCTCVVLFPKVVVRT